MDHYTVIAVEVTDPSWIDEYAKNVPAMIQRHGGEYIVCSFQAETVEGGSGNPSIFAVVKWPSKEAAETFYASEEYQPYKESRQRGSRSQIYLTPVEVALPG